MDVTLYGTFGGKIKKVELQKSGDNKTLLTLSWQDRNAGNDGEETHSVSVVLDTSELKLLKDVL